MSTILLFISFYLIFINLSSWKHTKQLLFREKIIACFIAWSIILATITETLNIFRIINAFSLTASWILVLLILLIVSFLLKSKLSINIKNNLTSLFKADKESKIMLAVLAIILAITFILAAMVAPSNKDAMSYQLGRLPHWIQNQSVNFYPTNITWQINVAPFASYIQLHFFLLSGSDYFANLVQWFFFVADIIAVSLIARRFGASVKGQITTVFIFATIPMAILQASTTHDPLIVTFFMLSFIYFSLVFLSLNKIVLLILAGLSMGLSFFTKQTAYVYSFPFFIWIFILYFKKFGFKQSFFYFSILCLIAALISLPFYMRNMMFSGLPLFAIENGYINNPISLDSFIATVIKNLGLHMSTPLTNLNYEIYKILSSIMSFLNVPENGPGHNWENVNFYIPQFISSQHNSAPNTIHLVLIISSAIFIWAKKQTSGLIKNYFWCGVVGFLLFCAIFKWQEAGSHLLLPLFIISTPLIGNAAFSWKEKARYFLIIVLAISSFYFLFFNIHEPIIPYESTFKPSQQDRNNLTTYAPPVPYKLIFAVDRKKQYFEINKDLYTPYQQIAKFVGKNKYKKVGAIFTEFSSELEYSLWVLLKEQRKDIVIEHVEVTNETARLSHGFKPDVVIFLGTDKTVLGKYIEKGIPVIGIK